MKAIALKKLALLPRELGNTGSQHINDGRALAKMFPVEDRFENKVPGQDYGRVDG